MKWCNNTPSRYQAISGKRILGNNQIKGIIDLVEDGSICSGIDGSVKDGLGGHAYIFNSGHTIGKVCGGTALTLGNRDKISLLRVELSVAIGILLVVYVIQVYMDWTEPPQYAIYIWIENADVLSRAWSPTIGEHLKNYLVLDYDLWREMAKIQALIRLLLLWEKWIPI